MFKSNYTDEYLKYYKENKNPIVIFYHPDSDGITSAWLIKTALKTYINPHLNNIKMIPYNYQKDFDFTSSFTLSTGVFVVDLSLKPDQITDIYNKSKRMMIIDHHVTSEEFVNTALTTCDNLEYIVDTKRCGAKICYDYVKDIKKGSYTFGSKINKKAIDLIDKFDRWVFENDMNPMYFNTYIRESGQASPYGFFLGSIILGSNKTIESCIKDGKKIFEAQAVINEIKAKAYGHEIDYDGHSAYVVYGPGNSSLAGDRINHYDIIIRKIIHNDEMTVSLYTGKDINVSVLAKAHGGGGHPKAAGYTVKLKK